MVSGFCWFAVEKFWMDGRVRVREERRRNGDWSDEKGKSLVCLDCLRRGIVVKFIVGGSWTS